MSLRRPELKLGPKPPVGGNAASVRSKQARNSFPRPQPDGRSFVTLRQPVYKGVSLRTLSAAACSTSLTACRRSSVGTVSSITMYHMGVVSSETHAVCRFFHTCVQFVLGLRCALLISRDSLVAAAIICRVHSPFGSPERFLIRRGFYASHVQRVKL